MLLECPQAVSAPCGLRERMVVSFRDGFVQRIWSSTYTVISHYVSVDLSK